MNKLRTVKLKVREPKGKTEFNGKEYYKYLIDDSFGHYFTKLLQLQYQAGDEVDFAIHSYKGKVSLKALETAPEV